MKVVWLIGFILFTILVTLNIVFIKFTPENIHIYTWPITINVFAFFLHWFDKRQSITKSIRIPNIIFYIIALSGGILGSLMGLYCFRHKTKKILYVLNLWIIFIFYTLAIYIFYNFDEVKQNILHFFGLLEQYLINFFK